MKKIVVPITCLAIGYFIGVGQPSIFATNTILGGEDTALKEIFVTIEDAVVRNGIESENGSWSIDYNSTWGKSVASFGAVKYDVLTSLDDVPTEEGMTVFLGAPVQLAQRIDGQWMITDFIAQSEWVSGETVTDCLHYQEGQWWAALSGVMEGS